MRKLSSTKSKIRLTLAAISTAALSIGALSLPAKAADPVTITIWTFGDVIQRNLVAEYKVLHPEVTLQIKKSDLDPLNGTNMVTACTSKTGPDVVAVEVGLLELDLLSRHFHLLLRHIDARDQCVDIRLGVVHV